MIRLRRRTRIDGHQADADGSAKKKEERYRQTLAPEAPQVELRCICLTAFEGLRASATFSLVATHADSAIGSENPRCRQRLGAGQREDKLNHCCW